MSIRSTPSEDSTIECAHCGASFYFELTRCPNCGRNVYPLETDSDDDRTDAPAANNLALIGAILVGWVVSGLVGGVLFFGARSIFGAVAAPWASSLPLWIGVPLGAFAGAFVAASIAKEKPRPVGGWVGGLTILTGIVLSGVDHDLAEGGFWTLGNFILWDLIVFFGFLGGEVWKRQQRDTVLQQLFVNWPGEAELYANLLAKCRQDANQAERLIEYERQFMPNATRRTLLESAVQRWERDNR